MKKNVAGQVIAIQMTTAADGTDFTGSVTCYVTGDGGTQAAGSVGSGACTHEGNGLHTYTPSQAETNYDHIAFTFKGTGAITASAQLYTEFPQTGDAYARLGAPAGASVSADISTVAGYIDTEVAAIKTKTDFLPSATAGAAGGLMIAGVNAATTVNITGNITGNLSGSVGSVTGAVGSVTGNVGGNVVGSVASVTAGVTVTTNNDKTGYGLSSAAVQAIWDALTSAMTTAGSIGKKLADWVVGTIDTYTGNTKQTGDAYARLGAPAGASVSADIAAVKTETASIQSDTNDIQTRIPAALTGAGNMKADALAINGDTTSASNLANHARRAVPVTFAAGGSTTTAVLVNVDGAAASTTNDVYNGRVLIFSAPSGLKDQACTITAYVGATKTATISAVTASVDASASAVMV